MSKSEKNLAEAFAGESQANRKYLAFAKQAEKEGFAQAAKLFRAAAEAETVHAHSHLKQLGGIKSTKENLEAAVNGEAFEFKEMYPKMIKEAEVIAFTAWPLAQEIQLYNTASFLRASGSIRYSLARCSGVAPVCCITSLT